MTLIYGLALAVALVYVWLKMLALISALVDHARQNRVPSD